jgi:Ras-related protein Rab-1A
VNDVEKHAGEDIEKVLLGNKTDMKEERKVTQEESQAFAENLKMTYYDTSAKSGENINEAFTKLAKTLKSQSDIEKTTPQSAKR